MNSELLYQLLYKFQIPAYSYQIKRYGDGLINHTYLVVQLSSNQINQYILQKINKFIFANPPLLIENMLLVQRHLKTSTSDQMFLSLIPTKKGNFYYQDHDENYWRLMPFIENTFVLNQIKTSQQAYQGAKAISTFLAGLWEMNPTSLHFTIPDFHNTPLRYKQFETAVLNNFEQRNESVQPAIIFFQKYSTLLTQLPTNLPIRVTHNDTKINNVLFDLATKKGIGVIDWDTLMPGWIIHDFGDMVRTFTNPVGEEEKDLTKVKMNITYFEALAKGFLEPLKTLLTDLEKEYLVTGALLITYEQGLRFLTDYLKGNIYYQIQYPTHNLVRAQNQMKLLSNMIAQQKEMKTIINDL